MSSMKDLFLMAREFLSQEGGSIYPTPSKYKLAREWYTSYQALQAKDLHQSRKSEINRISPTKNMLDVPTDFQALQKKVSTCLHCHLGGKRKKFVHFGDPGAKVMVLTDLPDYYDQVNGRYFSDKTGELLTKILSAVGLVNKDIYFTGALKCASPVEIGNDLEGVSVCLMHLQEELKLQSFNGILAFGEITFRLLFPKLDFSKARGNLLSYKGVDILFTDHPRYLQLDATKKKEVWEDLKSNKKHIQGWLA